jgi:hypothetical protein
MCGRCAVHELLRTKFGVKLRHEHTLHPAIQHQLNVNVIVRLPLAAHVLHVCLQLLSRVGSQHDRNWSLLHAAIVELRNNVFIGRLYFGECIRAAFPCVGVCGSVWGWGLGGSVALAETPHGSTMMPT